MNVNEKEDERSVTGERDEFTEEGPSIGTQTNFLTPEQIEAKHEEFFKAVEEGSVERLEQLFNETIGADPNMTHFTESLLMAAIRANQDEVADYLIDQLAVNVQYAADLCEFRLRKRNPIRHRVFSCRDLAYKNGMMGLVDLIDLRRDDVTPNIKRYLKLRLQTRLHLIHQAYLKRLEERNQQFLLQTNKETETRESSTVDITDENSTPPSSPPILPPVIHRVYKSHIEETIQSIESSNHKSIDQTGKKRFRFSNYTLHFRLMETPDINNKNNKQSSISSLPTIPLSPSRLTPVLTTNNLHRSISQASSYLSTRDTCASVCRSPQRITLPPIVSIENKQPVSTTNTKRSLPKRVNRNNMKYNYIPQQQNTFYHQPQHVMPVTLKSTAIGLPSDTRIIRD